MKYGFEKGKQHEAEQLSLLPLPDDYFIHRGFQTPEWVCKYMMNLIPGGVKTVLEPTPGMGNIKNALYDNCYEVTAPDDFFKLDSELRFDCVVMNPPFSEKFCFGLPPFLKGSGMGAGYYILQECMKKSDNVIALMPWFTISDSDQRLRDIMDFGLHAVIALPRKTFNYARIQTCILVMRKGCTHTQFKYIDHPEKGRGK